MWTDNTRNAKIMVDQIEVFKLSYLVFMGFFVNILEGGSSVISRLSPS